MKSSLIFDPVSEELIRKIFQERNFNSFTFNSDLSFKNAYFELSYSPYYLLADLYIYNPVFPEISINLVAQETLRLTSGLILNDDTTTLLTLGGSLFYYENSSENTAFTLFDLSSQKPEELIKLEDKSGISLDIGGFLELKDSWLPSVAFHIKNIASKIKSNDEFSFSSTRQNNIFLFETYSQLSLGKQFNTYAGSINAELMLPLYGYFRSIEIDYASLGLMYDLKLFSVLAGLSKNVQIIGMRFNSDIFNVGISFSNEKDTGDALDQTEKSIYASFEINL